MFQLDIISAFSLERIKGKPSNKIYTLKLFFVFLLSKIATVSECSSLTNELVGNGMQIGHSYQQLIVQDTAQLRFVHKE